MSGDCFLVAARWVADDASCVLVHGLPRAQAGEHAGHRYWHAWVERTRTFQHPNWSHPVTTVVVIDRSNGLDIEMPQGAYYNLGDLDEGMVWRYQAGEARRHLLGKGNYGPWVPGWEGMAL